MEVEIVLNSINNYSRSLAIHSYILFKALPSLCMKHTAQGESQVANIAWGKASAVFVMRLSPRAVYFHTSEMG